MAEEWNEIAKKTMFQSSVTDNNGNDGDCDNAKVVGCVCKKLAKLIEIVHRIRPYSKKIGYRNRAGAAGRTSAEKKRKKKTEPMQNSNFIVVVGHSTQSFLVREHTAHTQKILYILAFLRFYSHLFASPEKRECAFANTRAHKKR